MKKTLLLAGVASVFALMQVLQIIIGWMNMNHISVQIMFIFMPSMAVWRVI